MCSAISVAFVTIYTVPTDRQTRHIRATAIYENNKRVPTGTYILGEGHRFADSAAHLEASLPAVALLNYRAVPYDRRSAAIRRWVQVALSEEYKYELRTALIQQKLITHPV